MREAAQAVLAAYFKDPNAAPVPTSYMIGNTRSAALLHSLGFSRLAGVVAIKSCAREALVDARQMVLTPEQWHAVNPIEIATPRMHLRPLRPADATDLARIAGNDRVAPMMASVASPWPEVDVLRWIEQRRWRGRVGFSFGVYVPDGTLIGSVGLGGTPVSTAYFLDQHYWGRGLDDRGNDGIFAMGLCAVCSD
jgi:RimJ/RimL family protein N-acetyltransferase